MMIWTQSCKDQRFRQRKWPGVFVCGLKKKKRKEELDGGRHGQRGGVGSVDQGQGLYSKANRKPSEHLKQENDRN